MIVFRNASTGAVIAPEPIYFSEYVRVGALAGVNPVLAAGLDDPNVMMRLALRDVRQAAADDKRNARMRGVEL